MKKADPRYLLIFGLVLFGLSCLLNGFMSHDYAGEQLFASMLIRALGQPFIMVPLSAIATAGLAPEDTGSASALFNMMRNLGGSCGIALASTLLTQREQFHSERIGESVSDSGLYVQQWLSSAASSLHHSGASLWAQIVKRVFGTSHGPSFFVPGLSDAERNSTYAANIDSIARMPQTAFDKVAKILVATNHVGLEFDSINPNNVMLNNVQRTMGLIDFTKKPVVAHTLFDMIYGLASPDRFSNFDVKPLESIYTGIVRKSVSAASSNGLKIAPDLSMDVFKGRGFSPEFEQKLPQLLRT